MANREISTTKQMFMIFSLILLGLMQLTSGQRKACEVLTSSVLCINAEGRFLKDIPSENITVITLLRSEFKYLSQRDFSKFTSVSDIIIDDSKIPQRILNYTLSLEGLKVLQIVYSNITENYFFALRNDSALVKLSLQRNKFTLVKKGIFNHFSRLEEIDLSYNEITTIEADAFEGLDTLKKLDISYNMLKGVFDHNANKEVFDNLSHLEEIDLSNNKISTIEADAFEGLSALRRLDLSQNMLSDDFNPASLSLPAGCVFQSLVATCTESTMAHPRPNNDQRLDWNGHNHDLQPHSQENQQDEDQKEKQQQIEEQQEKEEEEEQSGDEEKEQEENHQQQKENEEEEEEEGEGEVQEEQENEEENRVEKQQQQEEEEQEDDDQEVKQQEQEKDEEEEDQEAGEQQEEKLEQQQQQEEEKQQQQHVGSDRGQGRNWEEDDGRGNGSTGVGRVVYDVVSRLLGSGSDTDVDKVFVALILVVAFVGGLLVMVVVILILMFLLFFKSERRQMFTGSSQQIIMGGGGNNDGGGCGSTGGSGDGGEMGSDFPGQDPQKKPLLSNLPNTVYVDTQTGGAVSEGPRRWRYVASLHRRKKLGASPKRDKKNYNPDEQGLRMEQSLTEMERRLMGRIIGLEEKIMATKGGGVSGKDGGGDGGDGGTGRGKGVREESIHLQTQPHDSHNKFSDRAKAQYITDLSRDLKGRLEVLKATKGGGASGKDGGGDGGEGGARRRKGRREENLPLQTQLPDLQNDPSDELTGLLETLKNIERRVKEREVARFDDVKKFQMAATHADDDVNDNESIISDISRMSIRSEGSSTSGISSLSGTSGTEGRQQQLRVDFEERLLSALSSFEKAVKFQDNVVDALKGLDTRLTSLIKHVVTPVDSDSDSDSDSNSDSDSDRERSGKDSIKWPGESSTIRRRTQDDSSSRHFAKVL